MMAAADSDNAQPIINPPHSKETINVSCSYRLKFFTHDRPRKVYTQGTAFSIEIVVCTNGNT